MLVLYHLCYVFVYTLRYFYTFSGTNLLTRCCSASCLFSAVLGFRKARKKIFSELDGTKAKVDILPDTTRSLKERRRRAPGRPHGVGPLALHRTCPFAYLYVSPRHKP